MKRNIDTAITEKVGFCLIVLCLFMNIACTTIILDHYNDYRFTKGLWTIECNGEVYHNVHFTTSPMNDDMEFIMQDGTVVKPIGNRSWWCEGDRPCQSNDEQT